MCTMVVAMVDGIVNDADIVNKTRELQCCQVLPVEPIHSQHGTSLYSHCIPPFPLVAVAYGKCSRVRS